MYVSNNAVVVVTIVSNKPVKLFLYVSNKHGIGAAGLPLFLPFSLFSVRLQEQNAAFQALILLFSVLRARGSPLSPSFFRA